MCLIFAIKKIIFNAKINKKSFTFAQYFVKKIENNRYYC
jgi:hypothetical protein